VIRQFGSKEGVLEAAIAAGVEATESTRRAEPGDVEGAMRAIVTHYEEMGDDVMRWLSLAERLPMVRRITERGVESHLGWVEEVFAPDLDGLPRGERRARRAALATATDVYVWHLLRRREGLGKEATREAMRQMVEAARASGSADARSRGSGGRPTETGSAPGAGRRRR
jgi:AcrR family transcriptional regulator